MNQNLDMLCPLRNCFTLMTHAALNGLNIQKNEIEEMHCGKTMISSTNCWICKASQNILQIVSYFFFYTLHSYGKCLLGIHTLRVHYAHAVANLNYGYSKYAKVARVHYFCTIALRTSRAVLTRAWASRRVDLRERRVDLCSKLVIIFCW